MFRARGFEESLVATITHSLQEVVEKLNAKITALERSRDEVQESVNRQSNLQTNNAALNQMDVLGPRVPVRGARVAPG